MGEGLGGRENRTGNCPFPPKNGCSPEAQPGSHSFMSLRPWPTCLLAQNIWRGSTHGSLTSKNAIQRMTEAEGVAFPFNFSLSLGQRFCLLSWPLTRENRVQVPSLTFLGWPSSAWRRLEIYRLHWHEMFGHNPTQMPGNCLGVAIFGAAWLFLAPSFLWEKNWGLVCIIMPIFSKTFGERGGWIGGEFVSMTICHGVICWGAWVTRISKERNDNHWYHNH